MKSSRVRFGVAENTSSEIGGGVSYIDEMGGVCLLKRFYSKSMGKGNKRREEGFKKKRKEEERVKYPNRESSPSNQ